MAKPSDSNINSFGTFLDSINSDQAAQQAPSGAPSKLLTVLADSGPQPVPALLTASGV
jgi:hypothetical protein